MRITLVSAFDPDPPMASLASAEANVGGVERVFLKVSQNLARRGHHVTLVCSTDGVPGDSHVQGVHVRRVPRRRTILRAPVASLEHHIPEDSDVVHVAATYPFTTPNVLRRARAMGIPSVLDFHFEPDPGTAFGRLAATVYRRVAPSVYGMASSVLVRSLAYGRSAPSLRTVPESKWRVIPNGVDPSRFRPMPADNTGPYLLFVGRLVPYKGLEVLLQALALSPPGMPLVVVGAGPLRAPLETMAKRLGVEVDFRGHVPDLLLPSLYSGAALTILPSVTGQECFGISLLESMACGTPVVASNLPGVAELARRGGLVAAVGKPKDLAAQIQRALQPGHIQRGLALSSSIHQEFSWDAVTDRLEEVYKEVARSWNPGSAVVQDGAAEPTQASSAGASPVAPFAWTRPVAPSTDRRESATEQSSSPDPTKPYGPSHSSMPNDRTG